MMDLNAATLHWLTEQAQQGIFTCDAELRICGWNCWLEITTGRRAAEVVGRPLFEVYPEIVTRRLARFFEQALQGQSVLLSQRLHKYLLPMPVQSHYSGFEWMQQSVRLAPLIADGEIAGVITIIEDVTERVAREEELRRQIALQGALHEIDQAILTLDLPQCLQRVVDHAATLVGAPLAAVALLEDGAWRIVAHTRDTPGVRGAARCTEASLVCQAIAARKTLSLHDRPAGADQPGEMLAAESRSAIAAPLTVAGEVIGALVVESPRPHAFSATEEGLTVSLATQAAVAIQNARLFTALRESEAKYRLLTETARDIIVASDLQGRITYVNSAGLAISGYTEAECQHRPFTEFVPTDQHAALQAHRAARRAGDLSPHVYETEFINAAGARVPVEVNSAPLLKAGEMIGVLVVARDITQRRQAEEKMQRTLADLARSNADLQQFAYVASHDLQEPLRMVASYVQLLGMRYRGQLDADADEFIGYAMEGAKRMQQLILDLLEYARVDTHGQPLEPADIEEVCRRVRDNLQIAIVETGARVTWDPLPVVRGDYSQLGMVFQNLISNAIKFHGEASPVVHVAARLRIADCGLSIAESIPQSQIENRKSEWEFAVRDNGIGIEPQYFERIFVIFQRLHTRREYSGTGIGLAICKKIIERHGGRIWVESAQGQGTTFYFTLPAA